MVYFTVEVSHHWIKLNSTWQSISESDNGTVEECINLAVACMPRVIYLITITLVFFNLPDSLFNCGSVKEMSLLGNHTLWRSQPKSINLPSLQNLEVGLMCIEDDLIKMILLGCPVLEELVLTDCWFTINKINSNVLMKLTIKKCAESKSITLKNVTSLVTADLEIPYHGLNELNIYSWKSSKCYKSRLYTTPRHVLVCN
jgi:hypothetical protein